MVFNPPSTASWSFKKICYIKHKLAAWMNKHRYSIRRSIALFLTLLLGLVGIDLCGINPLSPKPVLSYG